MAKQKFTVDGLTIAIDKTGFISLTDIAKRVNKEPRFIIRNWLRNSGTIKFLHKWEMVHYPDISNRADIGTVLTMIADNSFSMTPKQWIQLMDAKGMVSKSGRYGGTYAHSDIALNFCYWLSPEFQVYFLKEFQRLKAEESLRLGDPYNIKRFLASGNYSLLVTSLLSQVDERLLTHPQPYKKRLPFAAEADMINLIVFKQTNRQWRLNNPDMPSDRNQRDYASVLDLTVLNNLEFLDALLIQWDVDEIEERQEILQTTYDFIYPILKRSKTIKNLQDMADKANKL